MKKNLQLQEVQSTVAASSSQSNVCNITSPSNNTSIVTANKSQPTLQLVVNNAEKTKAEIMWALNCVTSGYSHFIDY